MFYLVKYYRHFICLISLLLLFYGALTIWSKRSFLSGFSLFRVRGKGLVSLTVVLIFLSNCFMLSSAMDYSCRADISLNYVRASQGLNPNGTRYNQAAIMSDTVLHRAIEKGALKGISTDDLRETLTITPYVQRGGSEESGYFISTQFILSYHATKKTAHLDGSTLLTLAAESYKEWFVDEYADNINTLRMDFTGFEQKDYLDICRSLRKQVDLIKHYMNEMASKEGAFQSKEYGETFQSVASKASLIADTMVEKLEAYVLENGISKEKATYLGRLNIENVFLHFDALKAEAANKNNLAAISMYENDLARIVLVPTYDVNEQFYMSQTRIGIDDFAAQADDYANEKTEIRSEIATNNHVLDMLSASQTSDGIDGKAERLVEQIENELTRVALEAETLVKEYSTQQANNYMTITVSEPENRLGSLLSGSLSLTLLFAAGIYLCAFAVSMDKTAGKEKEQE